MENYYLRKPLNRYYVYKNDGCVIKIMPNKPSEEDIDQEGGGYFYPYFEEDYYIIDSASKKFVQTIFKHITVKTAAEIDKFKKGTYYLSESETALTSAEKAKEEANGVVSAFPQCKNGENVYYFDTFISNGDKYDKTKNTFSAMNRKSTTITDTYGTLLKEEVKQHISFGQFIFDVEKIPSFLKGDSNTTFTNIVSTDYNLKSTDFEPFNTIYIEKLLEYMKEQGESMVGILKKQVSTSEKTEYNNIEITNDISAKTITLKQLPEKVKLTTTTETSTVK